MTVMSDDVPDVMDRSSSLSAPFERSPQTGDTVSRMCLPVDVADWPTAHERQLGATIANRKRHDTIVSNNYNVSTTLRRERYQLLRINCCWHEQ